MTDKEPRRLNEQAPDRAPPKRRPRREKEEQEDDLVLSGPDASLRLLAKALVATARAMLAQEAEQK